ncbi:MAG: hypothetical protein INH41_14815 [Myxococcaceae bacterium]|nr:hypothetical protein [Myxococcaceae bacterium]
MRWLSVLLVVGIVGCVGPTPQPCVECAGRCVDLKVDSQNCGSCGQAL